MFNGIEILNIAFVIDDVAETFELDSFNKGLVGGAGFFGETITCHIRIDLHIFCCCRRQRASL